jgi:hypothetical protein
MRALEKNSYFEPFEIDLIFEKKIKVNLIVISSVNIKHQYLFK